MLVGKYEDRHTGNLQFCNDCMHVVHQPLEKSTGGKKAKTNQKKGGGFSAENRKFSRDSETTHGVEGDGAASFSPALAFLPSVTIGCSFPVNVLLFAKLNFNRGFVERAEPNLRKVSRD